jgi:hypothetical protein
MGKKEAVLIFLKNAIVFHILLESIPASSSPEVYRIPVYELSTTEVEKQPPSLAPRLTVVLCLACMPDLLFYQASLYMWRSSTVCTGYQVRNRKFQSFMSEVHSHQSGAVHSVDL